MKLIPGLLDLINRYDGFIIDLWGCAHNGIEPYPGVIDCLKNLKEHHKKILFLSNAPRRLSVAIPQLQYRGIIPSLYDHVHTSGEETYLQLKEKQEKNTLSNHCFFLGEEKDRHVGEDLQLTFCSRIQDADFILCTGTLGWTKELSAYESLLKEAVIRNLPLFCANPDRIVVYKDTPYLCAGAIAQRYEEFGGLVHYYGKPFKPIYERVLKKLTPLPTPRLLAIGDSLHTDIAGASNANIDNLWILGGIHLQELGGHWGEPCPEEALKAVSDKYKIYPTYYMPALRW